MNEAIDTREVSCIILQSRAGADPAAYPTKPETTNEAQRRSSTHTAGPPSRC